MQLCGDRATCPLRVLASLNSSRGRDLHLANENRVLGHVRGQPLLMLTAPRMTWSEAPQPLCNSSQQSRC